MRSGIGSILEPLERRRLWSGAAHAFIAAAGSLDPSFGQGGQVALNANVSGGVVGVDSTGRIYLRNGSQVTRLTPSGSIDTSYGSAGTMTINIGVPGATLGPVAVQPDGKLIVGGAVQVGMGVDSNGFISGEVNALLSRINLDGTVDRTFGTNGSDTLMFNRDTGIDGIAVMPDGKIFVLGEDHNGIGDPVEVNEHPDLLRFNSDGTPDATFGSGGKVEFQPPGLVFSTPSGFAVDRDGKILVTGSGTDMELGPIDANFVLRFASVGVPDPTFASGGVESGVTGAPVVKPDGSVLLLGTGSGNWSMRRLNANGFMDLSFGNGGAVQTNVGTPGNPGAPTTNSMYGAAALPDGSILAVGFVSQFSQLAIVHYLPNGQIDRAFGQQGRELHPFPQGSPSGSIFVERDGKLLVQSGTEVLRIIPPTSSGAEATPNLTASAFHVSGLGSLVLVGQKATATFTLSDPGKAAARGPVQIRIVAASSFNSTGVDLSTATVLAEATRTLRLRPGQSRTFRFRIKVPPTLQPGTYELAGALIAGSGLTGNGTQMAVGPVIQVPPPTADLALSFAGRPSVLRFGQPASVTLQLKNLGNAAASGMVDLSLYASADQVLDPADVTLAAIEGLPITLAGGRSRRVRVNFRVDSSVPAGSYFLIATAAPNVQPPDTNSVDNTAVSSTRSLLSA